MKQKDKARCPWAKTELYVQYHDTEWGVPVHDDRLLFEFLILEGAQAGLSWETILKKRENYPRAFDNFDPAVVARYGQKERKGLLADAGIIRNRLKIEAAVQNAKAFLAVQDDIGTFAKYVWEFVGHEPKQNSWRSIKEVPAKTPESDAMSKDLKRRGFTFVGSTICYAFMQAVGMVNDHLVDCFRHGELRKSGEYGQKGNRMMPLYHRPHFTLRFIEERIIARFHLEDVEARRRLEVYMIDAGGGERLGFLVTATVGEGGWVDLDKPITVRDGEAFIAVPEPVGRANERRACRVSINTGYIEMVRTLGTSERFW